MWSVKEIAELIKGNVIGDPELQVSGIKPLTEAGEGDISFMANRKYLQQAKETRATAVIVPEGMELPGKTMIAVKNPYLGFAMIMQRLYPVRRPNVGIDPAAVVADSATIGKNTNLFEGAYIGERAEIADDVDIYPGCFIGDDVRIGAGTVIHAGVSIYNGCVIGERVIIHSGTVIGSDGFGFATDENGWHHKIPQVGNVIVEDDVEIGANCSIDRAVMGSTRIGAGAKLDNLIQIAHNVQVGKRTFIVAQVGVSGSSQIGEQAIIAGQVGIVGHVRIGDRCIIAAQAGVSNDVPDGEAYLGSPARPIMEQKRIIAVESKLPEMRETLRRLAKRVEELERKNGSA